jgi:hypothetical protein
MKIRAGYEISYDCPQPTPMILMLSIHPSRVPDLLTPDHIRLDPPIPANTYHDGFGNFCHVIRAPAGRLTMSTDFLMQDKGEPDATAPRAEQLALEDLPVEVLIYLLGSRYCETDRLSNTAWSLFVLHRLSRRHRRAARRFTDGFQRLVRSLSRRPLVYVRRTAQQA